MATRAPIPARLWGLTLALGLLLTLWPGLPPGKRRLYHQSLLGLGLAQAALPPDGGPPSPGARLERAQDALNAGDLDRAEAEAEAVLRDWPTSGRARLLLASVAVRRRQPEAARAHLQAAAVGPNALLADYAAQLMAGYPDIQTPVAPADRLHLGGRVGVVYDSAVDPRVVAPSPDGAAQAGGRTTLASWVGWRRPHADDRPGFAVGAGADRSFHFAERTGAADRTGAFVNADADQALGAGRLVVGAEGRLAFAGRAPSFFVAAGGLHTGWYTDLPAAPWVALRGLAFAVADDTPNAAPFWGELAVGVARARALSRLDLRLAAAWAGPDAQTGFTDLGTDGVATVRLGPLTLRGLAGIGLRWLAAPLAGQPHSRLVYPRLGLGLRWPLVPNVALELRGDGWAAWYQNRLDERVVTGLWLELWQ